MPSTRYQKINAHHYRHIWVVGDIHGEYQLLQSRLHQLSFYPETDLLISTGDKGNHEAMALEAFETGDGNMWLASGGDWFFDLNDSEQQEAIDLLLKLHHLPHIIEIINDNIKYVIAHADYPGSEYLFGKEIAESELLWPVDRVQKSLNGELQQINGADYFIFGHMMFDNIQTFANQIYIDTGTPKSGRLSFYKIK